MIADPHIVTLDHETDAMFSPDDGAWYLQRHDVTSADTYTSAEAAAEAWANETVRWEVDP